MNQRQERHAMRPGDLDPEAVDHATPAEGTGDVEEDLPELDVELASFDSPPGEPADPIAATPALTGGDPLKGFSDDARGRYEMEISSFASDLRRQSLEHKRSHGGDNVSGRNVISAAHFLRSHRPHGLLRHLGAIGGVLIGLGSQALAGMVSDGVYTTGGVLWGAGTAVLGAGLVVWHVTHP